MTTQEKNTRKSKTDGQNVDYLSLFWFSAGHSSHNSSHPICLWQHCRVPSSASNTLLWQPLCPGCTHNCLKCVSTEGKMVIWTAMSMHTNNKRLELWTTQYICCWLTYTVCISCNTQTFSVLHRVSVVSSMFYFFMPNRWNKKTNQKLPA